MFVVKAPYPHFTNVMFLPDPQLGNSEALLSDLNIKYAIDGTLYTYVTDNGDEKLFNYTFIVTEQKRLEILEFHKAYLGKQWQIEYDSDVILGYSLDNPFITNKDKKGEYGSSGTYSLEQSTVSINFRGTVQ